MFDVWEVLTPYMLCLSLAATTLGIVWAAMPGLTTNMAMALLLGLTYQMESTAAIVFLISTLTSSVFGGAISAILINIPGTPDSVPTQMAGYPLARRGEAGLALGCAITFSFIGNWIGILALVAFIPVILGLALRFSSWEICLLGLLGVAVSGTLTAGERPLKGWIMGCLGLGMAMVGRDVLHSVERFSFGSLFLENGINFLPVLIGLFGVVEIVRSMDDTSRATEAQAVGRVFPPWNFFVKYWKSALRSGFIGTVIGAIPGTGANIATFLSYNMGERITGKNFSEGDVEGVICSEVSNNACIGGALLPAVSLGIPGNNSTAIFLAALNLHGIVVGPSIAMDHPGFLEFLYGALLVANFLMLGMAFLLIKPCIVIFSLPRGFLMPVISVFCFIGAYVSNYEILDVLVMSIMGGIGYVLARMKFPFAPLVLGLILGQMVDENLRRTLSIYDGNWMDLFFRPIGLVLLVCVVFTFYYGIRVSCGKRA